MIPGFGEITELNRGLQQLNQSLTGFFTTLSHATNSSNSLQKEINLLRGDLQGFTKALTNLANALNNNQR